MKPHESQRSPLAIAVSLSCALAVGACSSDKSDNSPSTVDQNTDTGAVPGPRPDSSPATDPGTIADADPGSGASLIPTYDAARLDEFSSDVDHRYYPLKPGTLTVFEGEDEEGEAIRVEIAVSHETRVVDGVENRVVCDRVFQDGLLIEDTFDWFCQDNDGNVWYFGEEVINYDCDDAGIVVSTDNEGAWEAGVDGAQPGIQMLADFRIGDSYRQEFRLGEAEDLAAIVAIDFPVVLVDGASYTTLQTRDWNPLEPDAGDELKYCAAGVGLVREEALEDDEQVDLVSITMP